MTISIRIFNNLRFWYDIFTKSLFSINCYFDNSLIEHSMSV